MEIWLVTVGEPLPIDSQNERLYRTGVLANLLVAHGHQVVWWTSTFDHSRKKQRFAADTTIQLKQGYTIKLLHSIPYKKNVSIQRIVNHYGISKKFLSLSKLEPEPDMIICSLPTLELSQAATRFGKERNIPVVLDVRDLWPDLFLEVGPKWMRPLLKYFLNPMSKLAEQACRDATSIIGLTPPFVNWGVNYAKRLATNLDRDFPMGYSMSSPKEEAIEQAEQFWYEYGLDKNHPEFIACFFGTMGRQFELDTVIYTARVLANKNINVRFVLCGDGERLEHYKRLSADCPNIIFPGWIGAAEIWTLMRMSKIGLAPYKSIENFTLNLPNKPIEYLSAGLPILSSLQEGVLEKLLSDHKCGVTYGDRDELLRAFLQLFENPGDLKTMSQNAIRLYQEQFVAEKVYNDMIDYFGSIFQSTSKRGVIT